MYRDRQASGGRFYLDRRQRALFPGEQIGVIAAGVEGKRLRPNSFVLRAFHDVRTNEFFIEIAAQRIPYGLKFRADIQKKSRLARIREIYFGNWIARF